MNRINLFVAVLFSLLSAVIISIWVGPTGYKALASPQLLNNNSIGVNQWSPQEILGLQTEAPKITAKAAIFLETKNGRVLFAKNIHHRLPVASLVKVMTATVALDLHSMDELFTVSKRAVDMEPDKMLLIDGEQLTLKELLYGLFLISANDAAEVIAENTTGRREEFIVLMNAKAKQLGMQNSFFVNPTGLDEDENNSYSTAYDLALLTRFVVRSYSYLVDITSTEHIILPITEHHQDYDMYSGINLLTTYPGVVGFKTGFTPQSGLTLITLARKNGHEIIGVLLGSENRRDEAKELLDYSFYQLL